MAGTWNWTVFGGACAEALQYHADGTLQSNSAEATSTWLFQTTPNANEQGFYKVTETQVSANGKPDCYGDVAPEPGSVLTRYIQFNPAHDEMIICKSNSLDACFGPLKKGK